MNAERKGYIRMKKGYLALENGKIFEGCYVTDTENAQGTAVFTTGVVGYNATLNDPCNMGLIVVQTFPLIGVCGIIPDMIGKKVYPAAYVTTEIITDPSNHNCAGKLADYLNDAHVCCLCGIDTRALTATIRDNGAMNAAIAPTKEEALRLAKEYKPSSLAGAAYDNEGIQTLKAKAPQYNVAVINYGAVRDIPQRLVDRRCNVTVYPYNTSAEEILTGDYDGIILSDGPGDPKDYTEQTEQIKKLIGKLPIFACGTGHLLLALANGFDTEKEKVGHRGANLPVRDLQGEKTYITSQNHSYTVAEPSINTDIAAVSFKNANDGSVEGLQYLTHNSFSVQFIPQDNSAPADTSFVYDKLVSMLSNR